MKRQRFCAITVSTIPVFPLGSDSWLERLAPRISPDQRREGGRWKVEGWAALAGGRQTEHAVCFYSENNPPRRHAGGVVGCIQPRDASLLVQKRARVLTMGPCWAWMGSPQHGIWPRISTAIKRMCFFLLVNASRGTRWLLWSYRPAFEDSASYCATQGAGHLLEAQPWVHAQHVCMSVLCNLNSKKEWSKVTQKTHQIVLGECRESHTVSAGCWRCSVG